MRLSGKVSRLVSGEKEEKYVLLEVTKRGGMAYGYSPKEPLTFDPSGKMCLYYYKPNVGSFLL